MTALRAECETLSIKLLKATSALRTKTLYAQRPESGKIGAHGKRQIVLQITSCC